MSRSLKGVIIFTAFETVGFFGGVGIWFLFDRHGHPMLGAVLGTIFWTVWTFLEHMISVNVGNGRPPFGPLPPD